MHHRLPRRTAQQRHVAPGIVHADTPAAEHRGERPEQEIWPMGGARTMGQELFRNPTARSALGHSRNALTPELPRHGDGPRPQLQVHPGPKRIQGAAEVLGIHPWQELYGGTASSAVPERRNRERQHGHTEMARDGRRAGVNGTSHLLYNISGHRHWGLQQRNGGRRHLSKDKAPTGHRL